MDTVEQLEETALTIPGQAGALTISSDAELEKAGELLTVIKGMRKKLSEFFKPIITKAHQAHKEAVAQSKRAEEPLVRAEKIIKPKIADYASKQEVIREAEKARLEVEASVKRIAQEDARLEAARKLEEGGNKEEAEKLLERPIETAPIEKPVAIPKVEGISTKKIWKYKIVDEDKLPRKYLVPDEPLIGKTVREKKGDCNIPGVEAYEEVSVLARSR